MGNAMAPLLCVSLIASAAGAVEIDADKAKALEHLVVQDCGSCHGLTLNGGLGSPITQDRMQHYAREDLSGIILDGVPGTAMPPWRLLISEAEALWIADYLRGALE